MYNNIEKDNVIIMTLRLNVIEPDCNYGNKDPFKVCERKEESTEHKLKV